MENTEVIEYTGSSPVRADNQMDVELKILSKIEKRIQLIDRVMKAAISSTSSSQWVNMGGKPYPTAAAAETIARRLGIRIDGITYVKESIEDEDGSYYMYTCTGTARLLDSDYDVLEVIGTCTSRDQFFAKAHGANRTASEIDPGNIKKSAFSNMLVNAVTRLCGIRGMSWEQLEALGLKKEAMQKVEYGQKKQFAPVPVPQQAKQTPSYNGKPVAKSAPKPQTQAKPIQPTPQEVPSAIPEQAQQVVKQEAKEEIPAPVPAPSPIQQAMPLETPKPKVDNKYFAEVWHIGKKLKWNKDSVMRAFRDSNNDKPLHSDTCTEEDFYRFKAFVDEIVRAAESGVNDND